MSNYDDDYEPRSRGYRDDRAPPPYPSSAAPFDGYQSANMPPPPPGPPPQGTEVPPPPMGEQLNRRPSAMKRSGSQSRVPHLQPQFPDEASYLASQAPDLEAKKGRRHREFRDRRDGYESEEGEQLRKSKYDDPRSKGQQRGDPYDDRGGPPRKKTYDDEEPRRRRDRDRDRDRDYDDPPSRHRKRDPPGVEYGSDPVPAVRRSRTDQDPRRRQRRDDYDDDDDDYDDRDRDRRRPPPRRRATSQDDTRRRRRDYDDDDRSDYTRDDRDRDRDRRRRDDRDRDDRRRDRSRKRYSDDENEYDRRDRDRDRDRHRRRSSAPPKELKIGDYDLGPLLDKGKKNWGTVAPILTPIAMQLARKYMSGSKR